MAVKRNIYHKHFPGMRNDPGIKTLEQLGFRDAYYQWCVFLELAMENAADLNENKFKLNSKTIAQNIRVKHSKLQRVIDVFPLHLGIIFKRLPKHSKKVMKMYARHSINISKTLLQSNINVYEITIPNLLRFMGRDTHLARTKGKVIKERDKEKGKGENAPAARRLDKSQINYNLRRNQFDTAYAKFIQGFADPQKVLMQPHYEKMKNWIIHPGRKKKMPITEKGWLEFIIRWVDKEQGLQAALDNIGNKFK